MTWLERLNDRDTRRLGRSLQRNAAEIRGAAQDHLTQFAHRANDVASRTAHQVASYGRHEGADAVRSYASRAGDIAGQVAHYGQHEGADLVRQRAEHYADRAGEIAHQVADYGRQEGAVLAQAAAVQALRAGRAVKADPVPLVVGVIGLALLANLLLGRRRA